MMRAKFQVQDLKPFFATPDGQTTQETVYLSAVTGKDPFGPNGESEDNTYSRWTPTGSLSITITNPALFGKLKVGQKFYLDFTEAPE